MVVKGGEGEQSLILKLSLSLLVGLCLLAMTFTICPVAHLFFYSLPHALFLGCSAPC